MEEEMKLIAHATAALGLVLAATPALAELPEARTVTFTTSDIDLATPKGQKELNWRVARAVRNVCQTGDRTTGSRIMTAEARACIAKARNSALQQVAALIAAKEQKGG
jgi:UrcA family protein